MGKLTFKARRLDDDIIKDGLCAVSALDNVPQNTGFGYVVGGIATQSYLPTACRRTTSDIDLAVLRPFSNSDFKLFAQPAVQFLGDNGYNTELRKGHSAYMIVYSKGEEAAALEFARRSENNLGRIKSRLEEELARSRVKVIEGRDASVRVTCPEDIAVPKLVRCVGALNRNNNYDQFIDPAKRVALSDEEVASQLKEIDALRDEAMINVGDAKLASMLRFVSDVYDIRVLSELTGFNESALHVSANRWDALRAHPAQVKKLMDYALPKMSLLSTS